VPAVALVLPRETSGNRDVRHSISLCQSIMDGLSDEKMGSSSPFDHCIPSHSSCDASVPNPSSRPQRRRRTTCSTRAGRPPPPPSSSSLSSASKSSCEKIRWGWEGPTKDLMASGVRARAPWNGRSDFRLLRSGACVRGRPLEFAGPASGTIEAFPHREMAGEPRGSAAAHVNIGEAGGGDSGQARACG
jgi:hypothetical protein